MIQEIIVGVIGLATLAIVGYRLYRLFVPRSEDQGSACDGCQGCSLGKRHDSPSSCQH